MKKPFRFSALWKAMKVAAIDFNNDNGFKLAASLSYSMIFAIGPMLIVVISLAGIFFGRDAVAGRIYHQIKGLVGAGAATQIQEIIKGLHTQHNTVTGAIIGGAILVITATGVFSEIQGSINYMWSVVAKPKKGWLKLIVNRLISFSLIVALGFISLVSLVLNSLMDVLADYLKRYFSHATVYLFYVINLALALGAIILLFMIIFRILPDAIIRWKDAFIGAVFTGILFLLGKVLIGIYLGNSKIGLLYGAAASVIVILTWVYYSSIILYYGAQFTKAYANIGGYGIRPSESAVFIIKRESREVDGEAGEPVP